ncbi:helix-turn-helix domain-containing protein [Dysosmobacter sp.]|uniref:helix-turn-helix domain-containing protein n=1 Tax=Dysosmobacter sp. TaxID=2591382 RepID=UPI003AF0D595
MDDIPLTVTVDELATILRIGCASAYRLVRDKRIYSVQCGRRVLVPHAAIEKFLTAT